MSTSWSEYMLILFENIYCITKHGYFGKHSDECTWKVFGLLIVVWGFPGVSEVKASASNVGDPNL